MIKFQQDEQKVVKLATVVDDDGDVRIEANGVLIMWLMKDGHISMNVGDEDLNKLEAMGFTIVDRDEEDSGRVVQVFR
jgi:hypothetical protein